MTFFNKITGNKMEVQLPEPINLDAASPVPPENTKFDIDRIRKEIEMIEQIIDYEDKSDSSRTDENVFSLQMSISDVISIIPDEFCNDLSNDLPGDQLIGVGIKNLFDQLAAGKVVTSLGNLVGELSRDVLRGDYADHLEDEIALPLSTVVKLIPPEELQRRTSMVEREPEIYLQADVFKQSDEVISPERHEDDSLNTDLAAEPIFSDDFKDMDPVLDLMQPNGSSVPATETKKPVPKAGKLTPIFHMENNTVRGVIRAKAPSPGKVVPKVAVKPVIKRVSIEDILGRDSQEWPSMDEVAKRIVKLPNVVGCILSQTDGLILSSASRSGSNLAIGTIAPQIFKHINKYFELLKAESPNTISLHMKSSPMLIARYGGVFLTIFLSGDGIDVRDLELFEGIAVNLATHFGS